MMVGRDVASGRRCAKRLARAVLLAAFAAGASAAPVAAQRLPITTYTTRDGLPHYVVKQIVADSRGFLWFCTREGFARFDGRDFVRFGTEQGLPSPTVNDLIEAADGTYWIATARGLVHFDPRRRPLFRTYLPGGDRRAADVSALALDPSGDVWVGTAAGLYRARQDAPASVELTAIDLNIPDELHARAIGSLLVDRTGALWVGAGGGLYRRTGDHDIETLGPREGLPSPPLSIPDMLQDRAGRIWLATARGLHRVDIAGTSKQRRIIPVLNQDDRPPGAAWSLFEDSHGFLWAGTSRGLIRIVLAEGGAVTDAVVIAEDEGLPGRDIQGLAEDTRGNLWAGVVPYGAARLSPLGFTSFGLPEPKTIPSTLLETRDGELVAVGGSGRRWTVSRFEGDRFRLITGARPDGTPSWGWNQVVLQDRSGSWWFGSNEGVLRYPAGVAIDEVGRARPLARYTRKDGLAADVVIRLFEDAHGDVWISTVGHGERPNGLSVWRRDASPALLHFTERNGLPPLSEFFASSFVTDHGGHLWIGFSGSAGLVHYDGTTFRRVAAEAGVPPGQVRNMLVDSKGRLWVATYRGGVGRLDDPDMLSPRFRTYTTADGLSSNETHALQDSANGDVYVGTARGLDRLDSDTGRWTHYTSYDGLPPGEMQGALRDRRGALWFTYTDAVLRLVPVTDPAPTVPRVFITAINVAGRDHPVSAIGEQNAGRLTVPSGTTLRIEFAAPWFGAPGDLAYQYRLEGADRDWVGPADQRSVTYASMAPGSYAFVVRASAAGVVGQDMAKVPLTVVPPLWRRTSFVVPAVCVVALLAYGTYRLRLRRALAFANMRTRIATDLHDDIGANLTRISILSEVVRHEFGARSLPDDSRLASIARLARESVGSMSDIVWAINPERDTLVDLARKIRDVAEDVAAAAEVELDVSLPDVTRNLRLDMDVRRDLFLICKEALNNAVRHSRCRRLRVSLSNADDVLALEVADDGSGFDPSGSSEGNGLINMRRRAARIGATLVIESAVRRGTAVRVELPLGRLRRTTHAPTRTGR